MNLLAGLDNRVWAILPSELDKMRSRVASNTTDFDKLAASYETQKQSQIAALAQTDGGTKLRNGSISENGVAIINIKGAIFNVESYFDEILAFYFGGTSYQSLMADIDAVANNSAVQTVGFYVHSPGGDAFGMNETANKIAALTAKKPTIGYVYGLGASAAVGLVASTGRIVADAGAWIGSIGVVCNWTDFTGFYEKLGVAFEEITSTNAPHKRLDVRIPEERAVFMKQLDGIESVFIKSVAKARGVSVEKVKSDFGQGAVMAGNAAKSAGLIDDIGSWDGVVKELQKTARKNNKTGASARGENMSFTEKLNAFLIENGFKAENTDTPATDNTEKIRADKAEAEAKAANEQLAKLQAEQSEKLQAQIKTDAENFVTAEIKAGRMLPAEKEKFQSLYLQAAADDAANPLAEGTRLGNLKAIQENRKPHGFTSEMFDPKTGLRNLSADDDPTARLEAAADKQAEEYDAIMSPKSKAVN